MTATDPLAALRQQMSGQVKPAKTGGVPDDSPPRYASDSGSSTAQAAYVTGPRLTEALFQRLRYFENLVEKLFAHQKTLAAQVQRTGTAAAVMPHVEPLKNELGDFDPNGR